MPPRRPRSAATPKVAPPPSSASPRGEVELVRGKEHFQKVVLDGIQKAKVSLDIATADFKAMLVPQPGRRRAISILEVFRSLADRGVEIRILHSGVPSNPILHELRRALPTGLTIRRCPRLHAKAVIIDCQRMYLGSANLTGAGLGAKGEHKRNFEMGIWTASPTLMDAVLEQFNAIWEGQMCPTCLRRNLCPVPLEEPDLAPRK
ncbi:MAG: phospholipase D family protein [Phycisphaeraceae bacterium]|nr:phospholipase D family protein [Phycisphaeraceae bacterium]